MHNMGESWTWWVKEARHESSHTVWFHLYKISGTDKYTDRKYISSCQGMGERVCVCSAAQSCPALCDPMDCSPLGSSVHEILQARILEGIAIPSSRGIFLTKGSEGISYLLHCQVGFLPLAPLGSPKVSMHINNANFLFLGSKYSFCPQPIAKISILATSYLFCYFFALQITPI